MNVVERMTKRFVGFQRDMKRATFIALSTTLNHTRSSPVSNRKSLPYSVDLTTRKKDEYVDCVNSF